MGRTPSSARDPLVAPLTTRDKTSNNQNLCRPSHRLRRDLRIGELGVLAGEVRLHHPTGSRTSFSNKNRDLVFDNFSNCLAKRRPADWSNVRRDNCAHQHRRVSREFYANLMTSFAQSRSPSKREICPSRVLGTAQSD